MIKVEVFTEVRDRDRDRVERSTVSTWLNTGEVFSVTAHDDPAWSVLTFVASAGRRALIVEGTADALAARINADGRRQRRARA